MAAPYRPPLVDFSVLDGIDREELADRFPCSDCGGRGAHYRNGPGGTMCPECEGSGYDVVLAQRTLADERDGEVECPTCDSYDTENFCLAPPFGRCLACGATFDWPAA